MATIITLNRIIEWFGVLGWVELGAALVVAFGCIGELWLLINKLTLHIEPIGKTSGGFWQITTWIDSKIRPLLVRLKINGRKISKPKEDLLERVFVTLVALGVTIEFFCIPISLKEVAILNDEAKSAGLLAAQVGTTNAQLSMQVAQLVSTNLGLSIELEKLKHPRIITPEIRKKFIEILSEIHNGSKTRIEVITGNTDRETERFAFQVRKMLDEAGYGGFPSKYQLSPAQMPDDSFYVTNGLPNIKLPAFEWSDAILIKIPNLNVPPLDDTSSPIYVMTKDVKNVNGDFAFENPFTDREPEVIALFYGLVPPTNIIPTVNVAYSTANNPNRAVFYIYAQTKNTNAILHGVCGAFHEAGVTVGKSTMTGLLAPGHVAFFIPSN